MSVAIATERLRRHCITGAGRRGPAEVVAWLGAVQAQEYSAARWALGLRLRGEASDAAVERAFDEGRILRTHVMRPTWHFVTPSDIRWMLDLTAPRVHRVVSSYNRRLGLETPLLVKAAATFERALGDGEFLTRTELRGRLGRIGGALDVTRLAHVVMYAELEGIVCSGPRRGTQFTYALLAGRAPHARRLPRDEALAALTSRYLRSHGPATIRDFVWWSGLTTADARQGLQATGARGQTAGGHTYWRLPGAPPASRPREAAHLLPIYDEYLVAYRDRVAVPRGPALAREDGRPTGAFHHALVIDGQVAGSWRIARAPGGAELRIVPLRRLTRAERLALETAAARYARFLGVAVSLSIAPA